VFDLLFPNTPPPHFSTFFQSLKERWGFLFFLEKLRKGQEASTEIAWHMIERLCQDPKVAHNIEMLTALGR
jgi:hypothetical protein